MHKIFLLATLALLLAAEFSPAHAGRTPRRDWKGGSQCGLTDDYGNDGWKKIGRSLDLGTDSRIDPASLPTVTKQQLIISANRLVDLEHADPVRSAREAVVVLRDSSEAGDLYVTHFEYDGTRFTQILTYGGGNPTGLIFLKDTTHAVGEISDSDVICLTARERN